MNMKGKFGDGNILINILLFVCIVLLILNIYYDNRSELTDTIDNPNVYQFNINLNSAINDSSDLLSFNQAIHLSGTLYNIYSIQQVIKTDSMIVVFDGGNDYHERLYFFNPGTGSIIKEVSFPKQKDGSITGIRSVVYDYKRRQFVAVSGGEELLYVYSNHGDYLYKLPLGFSCDNLAILPDGDMLFSTTFNEKIRGKCYRLILTDSTGRIKRQYFPYPKGEGELLMGTTGFLKLNNDEIYFNWPLDDTIYRYQPKSMIFEPFVIANLGVNQTPVHKRLDTNWIVDTALFKCDFLLECFMVADNFILLNYKKKGQNYLALFDKKTGNWAELVSQKSNVFSVLFSYLKVVGLYDKTIIFDLHPESLEFLINSEQDYLKKIKKSQPEIYLALMRAAESKSSTLFLFDIKPE